MYNNSKNNPSSPCSGRPMRYDDSKAEGEYFTLDMRKWERVENHWIDNNRIGVGREFKHIETKVFIFTYISTEEDEQKQKEETILKLRESIIICKEYISFDRKYWIDLRKSRGELKNRNIKVSKEGTVWVGEVYNGNKIEVYVKCTKN
jgi:hypothetical protein